MFGVILGQLLSLAFSGNESSMSVRISLTLHAATSEPNQSDAYARRL